MVVGFRPLDGESFSKRVSYDNDSAGNGCFRPLDGESFSKPKHHDVIPENMDPFPSPRRGIIF